MVNSDVNLTLLTPARWFENFKGLASVIYQFQKEVFTIKKWNIFWIVIFGVIAYSAKKIKNRAVEFLGLFLMIALLGYLLGYTMFTGNPVDYYAIKTMSRFLIHLAGPFLILSIYSLFPA